MAPGEQEGAGVGGGLHCVEDYLHATADNEDEVVVEIAHSCLIVMDILQEKNQKNVEKSWITMINIIKKNG